MQLNNKNKTIKFESIEECIELKNYLIGFIKNVKKEIKDKGNNPELIINITKIIDNGKTNE
tara:strand:- start:38 stop:220 length:183 start_codon:yes stop_codon:yes gene_type:complete